MLHVIRKVEKETINKDRLFFCCAQKDSCNYFEWVPEEAYWSTKLLPSKQDEQSPTSEFFNNLNSLSTRFLNNFIFKNIRTVLIEAFA